MKKRTKLGLLAIVTFLLAACLPITALAAEKLDQNMSGADMTFAERVEYALQGTATGMLMVFAVLALLWGIVALSKVVLYDVPNKKKAEQNKADKSAEAVSEAVTPVTPVQSPAAQDDGELVAVITAAVAAMIESGDYGNEFAGGFRVVSFKRSTKGAWNRK